MTTSKNTLHQKLLSLDYKQGEILPYAYFKGNIELITKDGKIIRLVVKTLDKDLINGEIKVFYNDCNILFKDLSKLKGYLKIK